MSPVFQLQSSSIYLVNEFDNVAVFPNETSGRFNRSLIDMDAVYNVHGDEISMHSSHSSHAQPAGAFGAYAGPTAPALLRPSTASVSAHKRRKSAFNKTIALVCLSSPDPNKPGTSRATHLDYKIVTQVVPIEAGFCSPSSVAERVHQQVGFEIVLLDSKCFPILENDTTASVDFWKCNRKVLAASKALYTKLTGSSANPRRATSELHSDEDVDKESDSRPRSKRCCLSESKLDKILRGVDEIMKRNNISSTLLSAFECVICKDTMQDPQFSPCCKRIIGCRECIIRWLEESSMCPHCSSTNIAGYVDVHGMDELLTSIGRQAMSIAPKTQEERESDSDFDLPVVKFRRSCTRSSC